MPFFLFAVHDVFITSHLFPPLSFVHTFTLVVDLFSTYFPRLLSVKLRKASKQPAGRVYGFTMKGYLRTPVLSEPTQEANLVPLREQLSAMPETLANEVGLVRRYAERVPGM